MDNIKIKPISRKRRAFHTLSRKERGNAGIRLRGKILQTKNLYGGRFTSHLFLEDMGENGPRPQWFDFMFLGHDKFTIWNAYICTAWVSFWDSVGDIARERASALLSPEEQEEEFKMDLEPASYDAWGRVSTYTLVERNRIWSQFGDMTWRDYCDKLEREIIEREPPIVYESFTTDRAYAYGTGLHIVVDEEVIDRFAIERAMDRFMEIGQTDFQSPQPVPRERLPFVNQTEALHEGKVWTLGLPIRDMGRLRLDD